MLSIKDSSSLEYERNSALYYFNLWLNSNSKEIRVYGAEALIRLQDIGVVLSEQQIIKIKKLKRSRRKIKTCSGCLVDRTRIKDALSGFNLK